MNLHSERKRSKMFAQNYTVLLRIEKKKKKKKNLNIFCPSKDRRQNSFSIIFRFMIHPSIHKSWTESNFW